MTFLVYSGNFTFGSYIGIWVYRYFEETYTLPRWIPALSLALLVISVFIGGRYIHIRETLTLALGLVNTVVIQIVMRFAYRFSLTELVVSDRSNSFYTPARQYSALEILADYNALASTFPPHARTNMPGKVLFFDFLGLFTESSEVMGYLIIIISSLGGLLLYSICKKLFQDRTTAYYAFILYAIIPCRIFFFPLINTVTPLFMLALFAVVLSFLERKTILYAWLAGAVLYFMVFFEPLPLTTGLIPAGFLIHAVLTKKIEKLDLIKFTLHFILAFLVVYLIFIAVFSFDLFSTFLFILGDATHFNDLAGRSYRVWLGENLKEFFYSAGTPILIIFTYTVALIASDWKELYISGRWMPDAVFPLSLLATLAAVVLIGINRGEISRLWIYLAVLFQIPAAVFIAKIEKSALMFFLVAGTLVIQTLLALHRVGFVVPYSLN